MTEVALAHLAIREVLARYARAVDRRDWDLVRSCYHPDAHDDHGVYKGDVDGFIAFFADATTAFERTTHLMYEPIIALAEDLRSAAVETPFCAHHLQQRKGRQEDLITFVRYLDRFEVREGGWRIARRVTVLDWSRTDVIDRGWPAAAQFVRGTAGPDDPSYEQRP